MSKPGLMQTINTKFESADVDSFALGTGVYVEREDGCEVAKPSIFIRFDNSELFVLHDNQIMDFLKDALLFCESSLKKAAHLNATPGAIDKLKEQGFYIYPIETRVKEEELSGANEDAR